MVADIVHPRPSPLSLQISTHLVLIGKRCSIHLKEWPANEIDIFHQLRRSRCYCKPNTVIRIVLWDLCTTMHQRIGYKLKFDIRHGVSHYVGISMRFYFVCKSFFLSVFNQFFIFKWLIGIWINWFSFKSWHLKILYLRLDQLSQKNFDDVVYFLSSRYNLMPFICDIQISRTRRSYKLALRFSNTKKGSLNVWTMYPVPSKSKIRDSGRG